MSDVKFVTFRKKKYPVKLGYAALKKFKANVGKDVEKAMTEDNLEVYEPLLFYALEMGHKYTEKEFVFQDGDKKPITIDDMEMMLDDCLFEFIELVPGFFPNLQKTQASQKKK